MTERLYYLDSMLRSFEATVTSCDTRGGRIEVTLDRTAFYPTSGGQPFDTGTLGHARVLDVIDRDDGAIAHVLSHTLRIGERVAGTIDWPRRLDHMQQHTGQHVLSAAFDRLCGVRTVSFHLGSETSTIDLAREVTPAEIAQAEAAASEVVWEDRDVGVRFATAEDAAHLPLRKESARLGELRLIEVPDFDLSACGGTHVPRTGMVGLIAVAGWERFKGGSRVSFVCGRRALESHRRLRDLVASAARLLSISAAEIPAAVGRLQSEAKASSKIVQQLEGELTAVRAATLCAEAETMSGLRVVLRSEGGLDANGLKRLASAIVTMPGMVTVLVADGQPAPVVVARSGDVRLDAGAWLKAAAQALGGRGGGRAEMAQGAMLASAGEVLAYARETLGKSHFLHHS